VPYNLFKLFLVHKISAYNYICGNGKKKWGKKKERDFLLAGPGGCFRPSRARARAGAAGGPAGPRRSGAARADVVGGGPCVS
jgi:hypothetical protein